MQNKELLILKIIVEDFFGRLIKNFDVQYGKYGNMKYIYGKLEVNYKPVNLFTCMQAPQKSTNITDTGETEHRCQLETRIITTQQ